MVENPMLQTALGYLRAGLCPLPCNGTEKRPAIAWKDFQQKRPDEFTVRQWFARPNATVGIACGPSSGALEMIDFDFAAELFAEFRDGVKTLAPGLLERLVVERTLNGGKHIYYRCPSGAIEDSMKLTMRCVEVAPDQIQLRDNGSRYFVYCGKELAVVERDGTFRAVYCSIETRGIGGFSKCAPSPGYTLEQGRIEQIPKITLEERELLLAMARGLTNWHDDAKIERCAPAAVSGTSVNRPGDDYDRRGDVLELLNKFGWKISGRQGDNFHLTRPGKSDGVSGTYFTDSRVFYNFSSSVSELDAGRGYSPHSLYCKLEHGGDWNKALKALIASGFGEPRRMAKRAEPVSDVSGVEQVRKFLQSRFDFTYRTKQRRMFSAVKRSEYAPSDCWALPGVLDAVAETEEFKGLGNSNSKNLISFSKDFAKIAALEIWAGLRDEAPDDAGFDVEPVIGAIVRMLVAPRTFRTQAGVPVNGSFALWLAQLEPTDSWARCYNHALYARTEKGRHRLAIHSACLLHNCPEISAKFHGSAIAAGRFMLAQNLTVDAAKTISVDGRKLRAWELSPEIIERACGVLDTAVTAGTGVENA